MEREVDKIDARHEAKMKKDRDDFFRSADERHAAMRNGGNGFSSSTGGVVIEL